MAPILDSASERIRSDERAALRALSDTLSHCDMPAVDLAQLDQAGKDLEEMFLLVVVGEFNAGKSAFINALLGATATEEGVTPTTSAITLIRYGEVAQTLVREEYLVEHLYPSDLLRTLSIVDTPGTNAIIRRHEEITARFAPRSDLVFFVTSADRPFTESERSFMEKLRGWGKTIVVVLNKLDLLATAEDRETVLTFIKDNAQTLLGFNPPIFPVSARQAQAARTEPSPDLRARGLAESGFSRLEEYLFSTLDDRNRVRLKLLNPLGVAEALTRSASDRTASHLADLSGDIETERTIHAQIDLFRQDMQRDSQTRLAAIESVIYEMQQRGTQYFDDTLRLGRLFNLLNAGRLRAEFTQKVLADSDQKIDQAVQDLIDWMFERELSLWQGVMDYLSRRRQAAEEQMIGQVGGAFGSDRRELLQSVSRAARTALDSFDRQAEIQRLVDDMRAAVTQTGVAEVGAVGLGTAVVALAGAVAVDITGILAAVFVAGMGLYVIPTRRRRAQREFAARMVALREQMTSAMRDQIDRELSRSAERIADATAPYARFVRAERDRWTRLHDDLEQATDTLGRLRRQIEDLR